MSHPNELVLCAGTVLHAPSLEAKLDAAAAAGCPLVSLWYSDYASARAAGHSDADIRAMIADHGVAVNETEVLAGWAPVTESRSTDDAVLASLLNLDERDVFAMATAVGARSVTAVELLGAPVDIDGAAEAFASLCDRAGEHGLVVNLEFMPFSGIPDLTTGYRIVREAGRSNGGLDIDAWHFHRSGSTLDQLAAIPGEMVTLVQLSDAPLEAPPDIRMETGTARLLPGEGGIDLAGILRTLRQIGCDAPIGVEVFSTELYSKTPAEAACLAVDALRAIIDRAT